MPRPTQAPPASRHSTLKPKGQQREMWSDMDEHADQQAEGVVTSDMPFSALDTDIAPESQHDVLSPSTTAEGIQVDLDEEDQLRPT